MKHSVTNYPIFKKRMKTGTYVINDIESLLTPAIDPTREELRLKVHTCNQMVQAVRFMLGECVWRANSTLFINNLFDIVYFEVGEKDEDKKAHCLDVFAMLGDSIKGDENGLRFIKNLKQSHVDALIAILPMLKSAYRKNLLKLTTSDYKRAGIDDIYNGFDNAHI